MSPERQPSALTATTKAIEDARTNQRYSRTGPAMKGRIHDFGLADVLQLILTSGKSGTLKLDNGEDEVEVGVDNGWIVSADMPFRPSGSQLASRLVRAGKMTHSQMGNALKRRAETGEDMPTVLSHLRYADQGTLTLYLNMQMTETLLDLFTWKSGTYEFTPGPTLKQHDLIEPAGIEQILMYGFRIADEWPLVCARIPHFAYRVLERHALPPEVPDESEDLFGMKTEPGTTKEEIGDNERLVFSLCLPGLEVQTVLDRAPIDRFETCRCLSTLIGEGYVMLEPPS
jgi:hypothetical protein